MRYMIKRALLGILVLLSGLTHAEPNAIEIDSTALNQRIRAEVILPNSYHADAEQRYPVIYLVDGDQHRDHTATNAAFLSATDVMPEIIVVALSSVDRFRYFTPTEDKTGRWKAGQADEYIRFLADELQPRINREFRASHFNMIAGHSLGGLLAAHILHVRPALFDAYYLFSPSLWWDEEVMLQQLKADKPSTSAFVYLSLADEQGRQKAAFDRYVEVASGRFPNVAVGHFPGEDHMTTPLLAQIGAFRSHFADWYLPFEAIVAEPERFLTHYRDLTGHFGYQVEGQEWQIAEPVQHLTKQEPDAELAMRAAQVHLQAFPGSQWAHRSHADALALAGDRRAAIAEMSRAVAIARAKQDSYLGMLESELETLQEPQK
ncbi:hypothetical protein KUV56_04960 [Ferrimonas balearica]|uniref:alpha/beta hydrolase n=1 Tax=Ferrimonas balearica TaxID=44012 RepID=UPI001C5901FE|nr:alpha/beta hydrolase-fold protein [Ferrimonas balearica]MBW3138882.1 hypothetical protein [Ferrimonas balearica]